MMNDSGVSEVIGFILAFALSAVFLMISMSSFWAARSNSDAVLTASELRAIADKVASGIVQAGLLGQEWKNATMNVTVPIPQTLNGHDYYVQARPWGVYVNTTDGFATSNATTFKLDAVLDFDVGGLVYSSNEHVTITYSLQPVNRRDIHIHGE